MEIQNIKQSISVWLILKDGLNKGKVVLQQRAEKDKGKIQSFPFILQATISGKIEPSETIQETIIRETQEELGSNFTLPQLKEFYITEYEMNNKKVICHNFSGQILENDLQKIQLHSGALPNFKFIGKNDFSNLLAYNNNTNPKEQLVLFADQLEALKKLFIF